MCCHARLRVLYPRCISTMYASRRCAGSGLRRSPFAGFVALTGCQSPARVVHAERLISAAAAVRHFCSQEMRRIPILSVASHLIINNWSPLLNVCNQIGQTEEKQRLLRVGRRVSRSVPTQLILDGFLLSGPPSSGLTGVFWENSR